jgi:hypothetical protein
VQTILANEAVARWVNVGSSSETDSAVATVEAIQSAIGGRPTSLVVIFAAPTHDMQAVARAAQEAVPDDVPVIGCTTSGEISGLEAGSGRLVVVAMGGQGLSVRTAVGMLADGPREAGRAAAQGLVGLDRPNQALMLLSEGLAGERSEVSPEPAFRLSGAARAMNLR